jgi:hypothetical protein
MTRVFTAPLVRFIAEQGSWVLISFFVFGAQDILN